MVGLNQSLCSTLLANTTTEREFRDVISAYVYQKYLNGSNSAQVLLRLKYLVEYFRTILHTLNLLQLYSSSVTWIAYHISELNGGSIGAIAATSWAGKEAFNEVRRCARWKEFSKDKWGILGPGPVRLLPWVIGNSRLAPMEEELRGLTPEMMECMGSPFIPRYRSGTLPLYASREEAEQGAVDYINSQLSRVET
ncbi:hypothetical protein T439DRAFT_329389 [Meredithblackwellia eburnea MCA 4105]